MLNAHETRDIEKPLVDCISLCCIETYANMYSVHPILLFGEWGSTRNRLHGLHSYFSSPRIIIAVGLSSRCSFPIVVHHTNRIVPGVTIDYKIILPSCGIT